jgi:hypothetical protein
MGQTTEDVTWASIRSGAHWSPTRAQWVIAELKRSGLSPKSFAARYKVGLKRIYYWRARLETQDSPTQGRGRLVEIRLSEPKARGFSPSTAAPPRIEIELLSGRRISVVESVDLERLGKLVALLEGRGC